MTDLSLLTESVASALHDRDVRPIHEWAFDNVMLPLGGSSVPGRFNGASARHTLDVLGDMRDPLVRQVNILKPTQGVGTTTVEVWLLWALANEPGPTQLNFNTEQLQRLNWENRLLPMIKACPALRHLIPDDPRRVRNNGLTFSNGIPFTTQSATVGNLQSTSIRYQANDEIWDWDEGMFKEADARLEAFRRVSMSKQVNVSQAGIEGSDWHRICFAPGTSFSDWQVPCINCGVYQVLKYQEETKEGTRYLMRWNDDGGGIRYECPHCGKAMEDSATLKAHFNENGKYIDHSPLASSRTRRWNALAWSRWEDLVGEYREALRAKKMGVLSPLKSVVMKKLVEFWREDESVPIIKPEFFDVDKALPCQTEAFRFLTIDTQTDHFWACVREWESDGSSRLLYWGRCLSWSELVELQKRFSIPSGEWKALVSWERNGRRGVRPALGSRVLVDTGGDRTQDVYDACWNYGWIGLKGTDRENYIHSIASPQGQREEIHLRDQTLQVLNYESRGSYLPLWLWATTGAKDILANLRDGKGRAWKVPANIGDDYLRQINAEVKEASGANKWRWRKLGSRANHAWDCEAMQVLAASECGIFKL